MNIARRLVGQPCEKWLPAALILAVVGWLFRRALFRDELFAVRDAAHFYYPLYRHIAAEWRAGRVPLWNPFENLGAPLAADATSAVFYPGQLLFQLPLDFDFAFKAYVVGHVLLAAAGLYRFARQGRASRPAATMAALAYALGGGVLFQYCNVVFLVGAAWLPWAIQDTWILVRHPHRWAAIRLAIWLALMTLGGDPQTAYHVGLAALVGWRLSWQKPAELRFKRGAAALGWFASAAALMIALAAVQILPSAAWSQRTTRAVTDTPRSLYESPGRSASAIGQGIFGVPSSNTHHEAVYDFSIGPWRWLELFWPNVGGTAFPVHRRWMSAIPAEGRLWTPSLYMGLLPVMLMLPQLRWRRGGRRTRWLTWLLTLFLLGSLGWYGAGWMYRECLATVFHTDTRDVFIGQPVGGVYWFFVTLLPGYAYFRYPAKLWVVVALGVSCLAARGFDRGLRQQGQYSALLGMALVSFVAALTVSTLGWMLPPLALSPDESLGPFDAPGCLRVVTFAFFHTAVVAAASWSVLRQSEVRRRLSSTGVAWTLVALTIGDLSIANQWQVVTAAAGEWRDNHVLQPADFVPNSASQTVRFYRGPWETWGPRSFASQSHPARLQQIVAWERKTGFGRLSLLDALASVRGYSTLRDVDYECLLQLIEERPDLIGVLGAEFALLPDANDDHAADPHGAEDTQALTIDHPLPRAQLVSNVLTLRPLKSRASLGDHQQRIRDIFLVHNMPRNLNRWAVVETEHELQSRPTRSKSSFRVLREQGGELILETNESPGGWLVINTAYDAGWEATVVNDDGRMTVPLARTNGVMCGCEIPAGPCRIELRYRPHEFVRGAWISGLTWAILTCGLIAACYRRSRRQMW